MVKWCLGLAAAGPVTAPLFAQTAPFPILLQGHALGQETRETSSMAALGNWHSAPGIRQENIAGPFRVLHFTSVASSGDFPFKCAPICAGGWGEGEFLNLISSGLFLTLLQTLRVWNVGFGLWAHVPDSLPTVPDNAGQAREELLPSLSSCTGLEILVPEERLGQVLGV